MCLNNQALKLFPELPLYVVSKMDRRKTRGLTRITPLNKEELDNNNNKSSGFFKNISTAFRQTIESSLQTQVKNSFRGKDIIRSKLNQQSDNEPFSIQIVIKGGESILIESCLMETVEQVKKKALTTLINEQKLVNRKYSIENIPLERYQLKNVGAKTKLEENTLLKDIPYINESRQSSFTPSLLLNENISMNEKKKRAQKVQVEIGFLTGRPLCWTAEEDEIAYFRYNTKKLRQIEIKKLLEKRKLRTPAPDPPQTTEKGMLFNVRLPLTQSGKKTAFFSIRKKILSKIFFFLQNNNSFQ